MVITNEELIMEFIKQYRDVIRNGDQLCMLDNWFNELRQRKLVSVFWDVYVTIYGQEDFFDQHIGILEIRTNSTYLRSSVDKFLS
jgi:hypothetical protein